MTRTELYTDRGDSGKAVWRHFCGRCGSPITSRVESMPGVVIVKAGTLDDFKDVKPAVEVYTDHAAQFLPPLANQRFAQGTG
ncbi:MAG: GFA family protein [Pseudomonadales bacterium]